MSDEFSVPFEDDRCRNPNVIPNQERDSGQEILGAWKTQWQMLIPGEKTKGDRSVYIIRELRC